MGQLDKRTQQQDVACLLEEFGQIESINVSKTHRTVFVTLNDLFCLRGIIYLFLLCLLSVHDQPKILITCRRLIFDTELCFAKCFTLLLWFR